MEVAGVGLLEPIEEQFGLLGGLVCFGKCSCFWAVNLGDLTSAILLCLV